MVFDATCRDPNGQHVCAGGEDDSYGDCVVAEDDDTSILKPSLKTKGVAGAPVAVSCGLADATSIEEMPGVPLDDGVEHLNPELIQGLVRDGTCLLIDVRSADRAAGTIDGSVHVPAISMSDPFAAKLPSLVEQYKNTRLVVFFCQFCKHRAPFCANIFRKVTNQAGNTMQRVAVMEGGFRAWQKLGLPVQNEGRAAEQRFADAVARQQGMLIKKP